MRILPAFALAALMALPAAASIPEAPRIDDPKLAGLSYGVTSIVDWAERLQPGNASGAVRLLNDIQRLQNRIARTRGADPIAATALSVYLDELAIAIDAVGRGGSAPAPGAPDAPEAPTVAGLTPEETDAFAEGAIAKYMLEGGAFHFWTPFTDPYADRHLTEDEVRSMIAFIAAFEAEVAADLPTVAALAETQRDLHSLHSHLTGGAREKMARDLKALARTLSNDLDRAIYDAGRRAALDPERDASALRGDQAARALAQQAAALETMDAAILLAGAVAMDMPDFAAQRAAFTADAESFAATVALVESGTGTVLPQDIGRADLTEIAEAVLTGPDYGIEGWEMLIVASEPQFHWESGLRAFNGEIERETKEWEEFAVVTVERDAEGRLRLHHNIVAKFAVGGATTPIGRWLLRAREAGAPIDETRFDELQG